MFFVFLGLFIFAYYMGEATWKVVLSIVALIAVFAFPPLAAIPVFYILRALFRHYD